MKILYHHRTRGREVEGVHIRGITGALRELGHEVNVLSFPGADPENESSGGDQSKRNGRLAGLVSRMPEVLFELLELAYNAVTWFRIGAAIRRDRPDLVYERYSLFLWATVWQARRYRVPIILEVNDSALVPRVRSLVLKRIARRIESWCMRECTGLVFISSRFRNIAEQAYRNVSKSVVSPNAADVSRFDPTRFDRASLRAARGIGTQTICGYVGAFVHWHGVAEFVATMAQYLAATEHLALLLVGDGNELPAVREMIAQRGLSDRVLLPGRVSHRDIPEWIACMDYAVLPNSNEYGSPMKLFEFMAMAVPVVAPDYDPIAEVIEDGKTGWLFPKGRTDLCARRVLDLSMRQEQQAVVGQAARAWIVAQRQWRNNAEQLLSLMP